MIKYNINYINELKNNSELKLDSYLLDYFNTILSEINSKFLSINHNKDPILDNNTRSRYYKNNKIYRSRFNYNNTNQTNNNTNQTNNNTNNPSNHESNVINNENENEQEKETQNEKETKNKKEKRLQIKDYQSKPNININRIKNNNDKNEYDLHINNIRKILNKISDKNFNKLKGELLCYYKSIYDNNNIIFEYKNKIDIFIFETLIYNNVFYSNIYITLLLNLIEINPNFNNIMNNNLYIFNNIYEYIYELEDGIISSKKYDKYNCFLIFYINLIINKKKSINYLINLLNTLHNIFFENITLDDKIKYTETLNSIIFTIITNIYNKDIYLENKKLFDDFYKNIEQIKKIKKNDFKSINNKIIFTNMNIYDKYK